MPGHQVWCADRHVPPIRVSAIQSGNWSGPVGKDDFSGFPPFMEGAIDYANYRLANDEVLPCVTPPKSTGNVRLSGLVVGADRRSAPFRSFISVRSDPQAGAVKGTSRDRGSRPIERESPHAPAHPGSIQPVSGTRIGLALRGLGHQCIRRGHVLVLPLRDAVLHPGALAPGHSSARDEYSLISVQHSLNTSAA